MDEARDRQTRLEEKVGDETSMLYAGTTGAEARDLEREGGDADDAAPTPYGSREEVLERAMGEQREIEAAHGATPAADPSQRSGFNRILSMWTFIGALLGAGLGALAGWLAVHYRGSAPELIIALAAVGLVVGSVIVGAYRVEAEDGRVQSVVEMKVADAGAGTPRDEEAEDAAPRTPVGMRSGR